MEYGDAIVHTMTKHYPDIFDWAGAQVRALVTADHDPQDCGILDVGAGQGKYRVVLADYPDVHACEIFAPYVDQNNLHDLYESVTVQSIIRMSWEMIERCSSTPVWDLIVMGDVLEHMDRDTAKMTINNLADVCNDIIVVVPYNYPQGEEDGNVHQTHLQDDLSPELMAREYPELKLISIQSGPNGEPFKGLYRRKV